MLSLVNRYFYRMRKFEVPSFYKSPIISRIKAFRKESDRLKKDYTPTRLDFGSLEILLPRHFGFCYGVENAIEIVYKTIENHPDKQIYLISEMIHNPMVNKDLVDNGVQFIQDTKGNQLIDWSTIKAEDIVLIPAFGTTIETEKLLTDIGVDLQEYDTTCPFVEKVWKRSKSLGTEGHTIVIHGKPDHEETRATFSHAAESGPAIVIKDLSEAKRLSEYILGNKNALQFKEEFGDRVSQNFDFEKDLLRIGVVNQTTMLASDTLEISEFLKTVIEKSGDDRYEFADTRDTLCYATLDNQQAVTGMLKEDADITLIIGGYNSSNTSHLVELCEQKMDAYFINSPDCLDMDANIIRHFDLKSKSEVESKVFLEGQKPKIMITSGASCPDSLVDRVIEKILTAYPDSRDANEVIEEVLNS